MEQIVRNYGRFFLTGIVLVVIVWIFWGRNEEGSWNGRGIIGENFYPVEKTVSNRDFSVFNETGAYRNPEIVWQYDAMLRTGVYELSSLVQATDYAGRELEVYLQKILKNGAELDVTVEEDGSKLYFVSPGTYTLQLSAQDTENRCTVCEVRVPVNGGEGR